MKTIPVVHCFNNNYTIPASVAIVSMLINADKSYLYKIHILHSDITAKHQAKLAEIVKPFNNAQIEFLYMESEQYKMFDNIMTQRDEGFYYTKETFYRFFIPTLFPDYNKIFYADVDVVWTGDIAKVFNDFDINKGYYLSMREHGYFPSLDVTLTRTPLYTKEELNVVLKFCAGNIVYNAKKMREDNILDRLIKHTTENAKKLFLLDQDVLNIVCQDKIHAMMPSCGVFPFEIEAFENGELPFNYQTNLTELIDGFENPVQIHFGSHIKPWNNFCKLSEIWYEYLFKTTFVKEHFNARQKLEKKDKNN